MSRLITTILTTLMLGATQAEYTIKVPLQGESIQFKSPNTELPPQLPEPSEQPICLFSMSYPEYYYWGASSAGVVGNYNGVNMMVMRDINGNYPSVVTYEGKTYSRGAYVMNNGAGVDMYEICVSH